MSTVHSSDSTPPRKSLAKPAIGFVLVAVAIGAIAVGFARRHSDPNAGETAVASVVQPQTVTVYYFHGETRCKTCLAIETATERVVREHFAGELDEGTLRYVAVDYDAPEHRHFRDDYDLAFGSVVVQGIGDDRPWENLADVWTLIHDDPAELDAYLVEHITPMLAENR